ncbi:hypothetical protein HDU76_003695 [Blyttiomyces sp. JEL0837]|nr:hypothetical protein HDU76_003695 [Blyttiomyces sp. JEL0837]
MAIYGYDLPNWGDEKQFSGLSLAECYVQLLSRNDDFMYWSNGNCFLKLDGPQTNATFVMDNSKAFMIGYDMFGHFDPPGGGPGLNLENQGACASACISDPQCIGARWGQGSCYKKYPQKSGDPNSALTFNWEKLKPSCLNPRFVLSTPVYAAETITLYNPDWGKIVTKALSDCGFNTAGTTCQDLDVSEIFQQGNTAKQYKVTVTLSGFGYNAPYCTDTTSLIGGMLINQFNQAATYIPKNTDWSLDCPNCKGKGCNRRRDVFTSNATLQGRDSPCGTVPPGCTCVQGNGNYETWIIPKSASVIIGTEDASIQKNMQIGFTVTAQCDNLVGDIFDFAFEVAGWSLPLLKYDEKDLPKEEEARNAAIEKAAQGVEAFTLGSGFASKFGKVGCGSKKESRRAEQSIVTMPVSDSDIAQVGSHVCQYDNVDRTLRPGTSFLAIISFLTTTTIMSVRPQGCHCYNDGVTAICVNTIQQVNYFTSEDYAMAIDDVAVVNTLKSHCWQCNQTSFSIQAQTEHFQLSVFPANN